MQSVECRLRGAGGDRWGVVQGCGGEGGVGGLDCPVVGWRGARLLPVATSWRPDRPWRRLVHIHYLMLPVVLRGRPKIAGYWF